MFVFQRFIDFCILFSYLLEKPTSQTSQICQSAKGEGKASAKEVWLEGQESHCGSEKSADSKSWYFPFLVLSRWCGAQGRFCRDQLCLKTHWSTGKSCSILCKAVLGLNEWGAEVVHLETVIYFLIQLTESPSILHHVHFVFFWRTQAKFSTWSHPTWRVVDPSLLVFSHDWIPLAGQHTHLYLWIPQEMHS